MIRPNKLSSVKAEGALHSYQKHDFRWKRQNFHILKHFRRRFLYLKGALCFFEVFRVPRIISEGALTFIGHKEPSKSKFGVLQWKGAFHVRPSWNFWFFLRKKFMFYQFSPIFCLQFYIQEGALHQKCLKHVFWSLSWVQWTQ